LTPPATGRSLFRMPDTGLRRVGVRECLLAPRRYEGMLSGAIQRNMGVNGFDFGG
jgi:hypothetical protein